VGGWCYHGVSGAAFAALQACAYGHLSCQIKLDVGADMAWYRFDHGEPCAQTGLLPWHAVAHLVGGCLPTHGKKISLCQGRAALLHSQR
jgi:hypothetical protein